MKKLERLSALALAQEPARPALEYQDRSINWGEMRELADRVSGLIEASGAEPGAPIAFAPRNRPSAITVLLALVAKRRSIRMLDAYQSATEIARDLEQANCPLIIAAAEDFSPQLIAALWEHGIAGIALNEAMDAFAIPGREQSTFIGENDAPSVPQIDSLGANTASLFSITYEAIADHLGQASDIGALPIATIPALHTALQAMLNSEGRMILLDRD